MFRPGRPVHHRHCHDRPLPERFGLLCWNVQKLTLHPHFPETLHRLLKDRSGDIIMLQEAKSDLHEPFHLPGYSCSFAANIQTKHHLFGVLTAAEAAFDTARGDLSGGRELHVATHKSRLLTLHPLADGRQLLLLNVHAVNFVAGRIFERELRSIETHLAVHDGPMILAGDFNSWNAKRMTALLGFCGRLGLSQAEITDPHHIKCHFRHALDHVFYRGLRVEEARAVDTGNFSDHNPIYVRFAL